MGYRRFGAVVVAILFSMALAAGELEDRIAQAEAGDPFDQAELGTAFYFGNGVPQDFVQAYVWYSVAAESGLEDAMMHKEKTAAKLDAAQLERATAEAAALSKRLAAKTP
jgi:hypothetical protein